MMSVARPRIRGPRTVRLTLTTASSSTVSTRARSGRIRPIRRRAEGPKLIDFSAGIPIPAIGP